MGGAETATSPTGIAQEAEIVSRRFESQESRGVLIERLRKVPVANIEIAHHQVRAVEILGVALDSIERRYHLVVTLQVGIMAGQQQQKADLLGIVGGARVDLGRRR